MRICFRQSNGSNGPSQPHEFRQFRLFVHTDYCLSFMDLYPQQGICVFMFALNLIGRWNMDQE